LFALAAGAVALVPGLSIADEGHDPAALAATATPIKHLVVIFQENVSFDHYFGTYPVAANPKGEPSFTARPGTPSVNGLTEPLLTANPNLGNPQRIDRSMPLTCDQDHDYTDEQLAFDHGLMDLFVQKTGNGPTLGECVGQPATPGNFAVMDYYDGNTVTALWNYAQRFAMSDNSYSTGFGPSTPGAFEVIAGNTFGATCGADLNGTPCAGWPAPSGPAVAQGPGTVISDPDPLYDACASPTRGKAAMGGSNVGDPLNARGVTWGWFQGGFKPSSRKVDGSPVCGSAHFNIGAGTTLDGQACVRATLPPNLKPFCQTDYNPHHQPFMYWPQTANTMHLPPSSVAAIGHQDQANHQYDLSDFWAAADHGNLPSVAYLKAPNYQDGHAGYSDPLDEQTFLVSTINHLQRLDTWRSTAVAILYDDSDGWYDHQMSPIFNQSQTPLDALTGPGFCGFNPAQVPSKQEARCGFGPRQPFLLVSPWARQNSVDHSISSQTSVVRFIEDNWSLGRVGGGSFDSRAGSLGGMFDFSHPSGDPLLLNPETGQPVHD
jgi:phospholipase C